MLACFLLSLSADMNNCRKRVFFPSLLAFVLLYYSAAWAILRCYHDDTHDEEISVASEAQGKEDHLLLPRPKAMEIHCLDFEFQSQALATPPSPQSLRAESRGGIYAHKPLAVQLTIDLRSSGPSWIRNRGSPPILMPSDRSVYLVLSTLRI